MSTDLKHLQCDLHMYMVVAEGLHAWLGDIRWRQQLLVEEYTGGTRREEIHAEICTDSLLWSKDPKF